MILRRFAWFPLVALVTCFVRRSPSDLFLLDSMSDLLVPLPSVSLVPVGTVARSVCLSPGFLALISSYTGSVEVTKDILR